MAKFALVLCTLLIVFNAPHPTISAEISIDELISIIDGGDLDLDLNTIFGELDDQDIIRIRAILDILAEPINAIRDLPEDSACGLSAIERVVDIYNKIDENMDRCIRGSSSAQNGSPVLPIDNSLISVTALLRGNNIVCVRTNPLRQQIPLLGGTSVTQQINEFVNAALRVIEDLSAQLQLACIRCAPESILNEIDELLEFILAGCVEGLN